MEVREKIHSISGYKGINYGWIPVSMKNDWITIYGDDVIYLNDSAMDAA